MKKIGLKHVSNILLVELFSNLACAKTFLSRALMYYDASRAGRKKRERREGRGGELGVSVGGGQKRNSLSLLLDCLSSVIPWLRQWKERGFLTTGHS